MSGSRISTRALLDEAIRLCPEPLVALQAEYHPYLDQTEVLAACRRHGLVFVAYCPLARGRMIGDPTIVEIARTRGQDRGPDRAPLARSTGRCRRDSAIGDIRGRAQQEPRGVWIRPSTDDGDGAHRRALSAPMG